MVIQHRLPFPCCITVKERFEIKSQVVKLRDDNQYPEYHSVICVKTSTESAYLREIN